MPKFLARVAKEIVDSGHDLRKLAVVFPNRRAGAFFKRELGRSTEDPIWVPRVLSIEDFVLENLNLKLADNLSMILRLYRSYTETKTGSIESFQDFSRWGSILLSDFNEIDNQLVDTRQLFSYIADAERIRHWDLDPEKEQTPLMQNYFALWENLYSLYEHFRSSLLSENLAYQGLAYRTMNDRLEEIGKTLSQQYEQIYFVGFSALSKSEENIFTSLLREGVASFYLDIDEYYLENPMHEAGRLLSESRLLKELRERNELRWMGNQLKTGSKKLSLINASGDNFQAIAANEKLRSFEQDDTAVVLADEGLLKPFLNNLSEDLGPLNITMGIPINNSPLAAFFTSLLDMLSDGELQQKKDEYGYLKYRFVHWDSLLNSSALSIVGLDVQFKDLRKDLIDRRAGTFSAQYLQNFSGEITAFPWMKLLHRKHLEISESCVLLRDLAFDLGKNGEESSEKELELAYAFYKIFDRLHVALEEFPYLTDHKTLLTFFRELLRRETLDVFGKPLTGIQIMGLLETRALDFSNVIMTSVNEDVLPGGMRQNSMVPYDIRAQFGLPTIFEKDSVFAYHFYRLLQGSDNVILLYNGKADGLSSGEPSRFIRQLQLELLESNPNIELEIIDYGLKVSVDQSEAEIVKTPEIMDRLREMAIKGFSPSALCDYLEDPVAFYNKRVLGLGTPMEMEEVLGFDTQGTVVHNLLEKFYTNPETERPYELLRNDLPCFGYSKEYLRQMLIAEIRHESPSINVESGRNYLIVEILINMVYNFLRAESRSITKFGKEELRMLALEEDITTSVSVGNMEVNIRGIVDRVDKVGGELRIIDYKTGNVAPTELSIKEMSDIRYPEFRRKSFQIMTYAWLYWNSVGQRGALSVKPGIISLRNVFQSPFYLRYDGKTTIDEVGLGQFEALLKGILDEIFDPDTPFSKKSLTLVVDD